MRTRTFLIWLIIVAFNILIVRFLGRRQNLEKNIKNGKSLRYFNSEKFFDKQYYHFLEELGIIGNVDFIELNQTTPAVTFISAISENHAAEGRSMVLRMAKEHPNWKIVVWDIGLSKETRKWFQKACNLDVRDIDLEYYGISAADYRWKPIVIAKSLQEFPAVFWMDTSTFWHPNVTIEDFVTDLNPKHTDREPNHYIFDPVSHSTYATTAEGMYEYLKPQKSVKRIQYEASKQLIFRTQSTMELSMKWWVLCALEKKCMAPEGHVQQCNFLTEDRMHTYHNCHRYDQSAINIILMPYRSSFPGYPLQGYMWTLRDITSDEQDVHCI